MIFKCKWCGRDLTHLKTDGAYSSQKHDFGFFETPPNLAKRVVDLAQLEAGMVVLEPSAGRGGLANVIAEVISL